MGLFGKLFGSKEPEQLNVTSPLDGKVLRMEEVPDQAFSQKMMGDGFAIEPTSGNVYAPISAEVALVFEATGHAIGLKTEEGLEILLHFGVDTVNLQGEGFDVKVKQGDKVNAGDLLLVVDLESVKAKAPSVVTPVIFTNLAGKELAIDESLYGTTVSHGDVIVKF
ncbi:PTS glucose transporter subunit IIA [Mollicutes bacterium LVI A0039]|nr:PTS glucose transporter subunit IIA [Mollicutes bacterium LVI A0039]